jgi:citrate lyase subunit beta/citryl-CoA lyase
MQDELGPVFDITCDCEDGAETGQEKEHAEMIVDMLNSPANKLKMAGVRIHDHGHPHWEKDVDILVGGLAEVLAYITIPKTTSAAHAQEMIRYIQEVTASKSARRSIPVHILIETHGALRDIWSIAALPMVQTLDFGLRDFVSGHHGAIPASAMRSPGQFEHALLARAKSELVAAALANGVVPSHNVSLDLKSRDNTFSDAARARNEFGFLRMWSIYPTQIQAIVDAMKPDYSEVDNAANILIAAQEVNWGPIQYEGELYDRASYRFYWEVLKKARITGVTVPEKAEEEFFRRR